MCSLKFYILEVRVSKYIRMHTHIYRYKMWMQLKYVCEYSYAFIYIRIEKKHIENVLK